MNQEGLIDVGSWDDQGVDLEQIVFNLSLTPAARLRQLMETMELIGAVRGQRVVRDGGGRIELLERLNEHGVMYVIVGDLAAAVHGATAVTQNLEVCASLVDGGAARVIQAFEGLRPRWRMRSGRPVIDEVPGWSGGNLYLRTDRGQIDVVDVVTGLGRVEELMGRSVKRAFAGMVCRVLDLATVIEMKRRSGREVDGVALMELERIRKKQIQ